jgi:cytochrome c-type biogenesis protein CcmH
VLLLLMLLPAAPARAGQHVENPLAVPVVPRTQLEKDLQNEIICMCGTCGRKRIGECTCSLAAEMREEVARMVAQGKTREQIYDYYIAKYGSQEPLASPHDKGFNRLAWFLPYLAGATGAAFIALVAFRWSRRENQVETEAERQPEVIDDPALRERLDDELRDLD